METKTFTYGWLALLLLAGALVMVFSCEENTGPEGGKMVSIHKLLIYPENSSISANGGSTRIFVKVYSGTDTTNTVSGVSVNFTAAQAGTSVFIHVDNNLTDSNGIAVARVYGGKNPGTIAVTASIQVSSKEKYSDTIFVTVLPGAGLVYASPIELLADGVSQSLITATVVDSLGQPISGALVTFVTTAGVVTSQSFSDDKGKATAILKSTPSTTDISATVTATSSVGKAAVVEVPGESGEKVSKVAGALGSVTILFKGITITGTVEKNIVLANEADSTIITLTVKETTSGEPVKGASLTYSATLGKLKTTKGATDSFGTAQVVLLGANVAGDAEFTATIAEGLTFTTKLSLIKEIMIRIVSSPSVLSANGKDISSITASLSDVDGNPIQGVTIYFTTTDGVILPNALTDQWGEASVSLRSSRFNSIATVTAKYGLIEKSTNVQFEGTKLTLLATPLILVANKVERSKLTITFIDASNAPIVDETVTILTTLGTLYTEDGASSGSTIADSTSADGKITAYIASDRGGDALVSVSAPGSDDSLTISFTNYTFSLAPEKEEILAGGQTTYVVATLRDINGTISPINVDDIKFSTTLGEIGTIAAQQNGTVKAELISGTSAGTATVSASMSDPPVTTTVLVLFKATKANSIHITTDRPTVKLGGGSASILATVYDETGNPKSGETVTFTILKGPGGGEEITPGTAVTNGRGQALVSFITGISGSERDGVLLQAKIGTIKSNILTLTISGEPKSVKVGYSDTYDVNEDGTYSVMITAIVADVNRNSVVDGTIVNFLLKGDAGVIIGQVPTVGGVASTELKYSPSDAGKTVELTVTAGGEKGEISFPLAGFQPAFFSIIAEPRIIPADGKAKIKIRVILFNSAGASGRNIPDGTKVALTTEGGTLDPVVASSDSGIAVAYLTSDKKPGKIKITAKAGECEDFTYVDFEEVGSTVNEVSAIELEVDNSKLRADGISSTLVRARLKKFDGSPVTTPTTVNFETDLGEITRSALSDENGVAEATFSSNTVGTALIKVSVGSVYDYINVFLMPGLPLSIGLKFEPNSVGVQGSGRNVTLLITANVKDDKNNAVADSNLVEFELIGVVDPDASLSPSIAGNKHMSEPIPTVNGSARVSFHAGTISGTVRVKAVWVDENGEPIPLTDKEGRMISPEVSSETTEFQVFAGPPYLDMSDPSDPFTESRMTLSGGPLNIYAGELNTENSKSSIGILMGDKYKNPVPKGTSVWVTTTGGIITTSTGFTEDVNMQPVTPAETVTNTNEGMTYVTLYAGNPFPTRENSRFIPNPNAQIGGPASFEMPSFDFDGDGVDNDGIAFITAYSKGVDNEGRTVMVWNYVPIIFSLQVSTFEIESDRDIVYIGQTATITVTVHDKNGNPVVGGSVLKFASSKGKLSSEEIVTSAFGRTRYSVSLLNDLDPISDISTDTIVTVILESPNGNVSSFSQPIHLSINTGP